MQSSVETGAGTTKEALWSNRWAHLATLKPHVTGDKLYKVRVRVVLFQRIISGYQLERDDQASFSFRGHSSSARRSTHAGPLPRGSWLTARGTSRSLTFHIMNKYITHYSFNLLIYQLPGHSNEPANKQSNTSLNLVSFALAPPAR